MPQPRVLSGTAPSAAVLNTYAQSIDDLSIACKVKRTGTTTLGTTTDVTITWQAVDYDTKGTMWAGGAPTAIVIPLDGVYRVTLQERFAAVGGGSGQRAGKIMVNGTSVFANSVASDKRAADASGEGVTLGMTAVIRCVAGDLIYANMWQSSGSTITVLQTDFGGTFMSVKRTGPLAA